MFISIRPNLSHILVDVRHKMSNVRALISTATLVLLSMMIITSGCTSKYVKPRSEVIQEAKSDGLPVRTPEEDAQLFLRRDKLHENRLMTLLKRRSDGAPIDRGYRIGADDQIEINVFDVPELNLNVPVRQSGFISLPLIGALRASGLTIEQFTEDLSKRLKEYVRDPQVNATIATYGSQNVAVMGAVEKPGTVALKKGVTSVVEVIGEAGGMKPEAGNFLTFIPAEISGMSAESTTEARAKLSLASHQADTLKESGIEIPLDMILGTTGGIPLEIPVRGGDMIIIAESGTVLVDGEVQKPGSYQLGKRMSLLGSLAAAGGITYSSKPDEVEVLRDVGEPERARFVVNLEDIARGVSKDIKLRDGDIVVVPTHSGRRVTQSTMDGLASLINFGVGGQYNVN